jgi:hypothetical protein
MPVATNPFLVVVRCASSLTEVAHHGGHQVTRKTLRETLGGGS